MFLIFRSGGDESTQVEDSKWLVNKKRLPVKDFSRTRTKIFRFLLDVLKIKWLSEADLNRIIKYDFLKANFDREVLLSVIKQTTVFHTPVITSDVTSSAALHHFDWSEVQLLASIKFNTQAKVIFASLAV